jgi:hypothetical protein
MPVFHWRGASDGGPLIPMVGTWGSAETLGSVGTLALARERRPAAGSGPAGPADVGGFDGGLSGRVIRRNFLERGYVRRDAAEFRPNVDRGLGFELPH